VFARYLTLGLLAVVVLTACSAGPAEQAEPSGQATPTARGETGSTGSAGMVSPTPTPMPPTLKPPAPPSASSRPSATLTGTVFHSDVEGGCLGLTGDDGKNYELLGTAGRDVLVPGARVRVSGRVRTDVATICQIGTPFEVTSAERL
jgi:hypothetical protein